MHQGEIRKLFYNFALKNRGLQKNVNVHIRTAINRRTSQALCEIAYPLFELYCLQNSSIFKDARIPDEYIHIGSGFHINLQTGHIKIRASKILFLQWVKFIGVFLLTFISVLFSTRTNLANPSSCNVLMLGLPVEWTAQNKRKYAFFDHIENSKTSPLLHADFYFIERHTAKKTIFKDNFFTARHAELCLLSSLDLGFKKRCILLFLHIFSFFRMHVGFLSNPLTLLFAKERGWEQVLLKLDEWKAIDSIFLTTSHLAHQPVWVQAGVNFEVHMLHYAIAPCLHVYREDPEQIFAETYLPLMFALSMRHWVWTDNDALILHNRYNITDIIVSGVPQFIISDGIQIPSSRLACEIVIFDVTPLSPQTNEFKKIGFYYGKTELACQLIEDVCSVAADIAEELGITIKIKMKPKRAKKIGRDDTIYNDYIETLCRDNPYFELLSSNTPIEDTFVNKPFVVSRPYTSTGVLAAIFNVNSVFYDPTMTLVDTAPKYPRLSFVSGVENLKHEMRKYFQDLSSQ